MSETTPPSYRPFQDGLRATGRYLDQNGRRLVSLLVAPDGVVVTMLPRDLHSTDEAVLLADDDLRALWAEARAARGRSDVAQASDALFPTGYEDFLRALGDAAARQNWSALRLVRVGDEAILRHGAAAERKEMVLAAADVEAILNRAFRQRGRGPLS